MSQAPDQSEESRIERDEGQGRQWATDNGAEVVAVSVDRGVSGAVSPWKRKGLGPWLNDANKVRQYDVIVASTLDRFGRDAADLHDLKEWAESNDKTLQVLKPDLVWPPPPGAAGYPYRIMWSLLADLAEIEREIITERIEGGLSKVRANAALIGKPTFGFEVVGSKYNKTLRPVPALVPVLREMIARALAGDSFRSIARWLDTTGVRPVQAGRSVKGGTTTGSDLWSAGSVSNILRSSDLKGRRVESGRTHKFESLLTVAEWNELQTALPKGQQGPITSETPMLTGILRCEKCGGPMYRIMATSKVRAGEFNYRCKGTEQIPSRCANAVPLNDIEAWVDRWFTKDGPFADTEIIETTVIAGEDHQAEADELAAEIRELDIDAEDYVEQVATLRAERRRLLSLPTEPTQVVERPTGRTVGEVWLTLDDAAKRRYLLAAGVTVRVLSSAKLRATPGQESRSIHGDPYKVIGTLRGIIEADAD